MPIPTAPAPTVVVTGKGLSLWVRPMTTDDLVVVQAIEHRAHFHPWRPGHFTDSLKAGNIAVVAESATDCETGPGVIVGYGILSLGGREADLLNLAVAPENRRQGIASGLLDYLIAQLAGRADNLFLEVRASNSAAIALYENLGFNQVGLRPNYYPAPKGRREDALILARTLVS